MGDDYFTTTPTERARSLIQKWVNRLGPGFHPDTRGVDYTDHLGRNSLTKIEAREYEDDIDQAFEMMGADGAYSYTLDCIQRALMELHLPAKRMDLE